VILVFLFSLMHTGTLQREMIFQFPFLCLFFNLNANKLIVVCRDNIFAVDCSQESTKSVQSPPQALRSPHALALSPQDDILVIEDTNRIYGFDTASLSTTWMFLAVSNITAFCIYNDKVLLTQWGNPAVVLQLKSGKEITKWPNIDGYGFGLGIVEGDFLSLLFPLPIRSPHIRVPRHASAHSAPPTQAFTTAT
jgi:hypothetical protein